MSQKLKISTFSPLSDLEMTLAVDLNDCGEHGPKRYISWTKKEGSRMPSIGTILAWHRIVKASERGEIFRPALDGIKALTIFNDASSPVVLYHNDTVLDAVAAVAMKGKILLGLSDETFRYVQRPTEADIQAVFDYQMAMFKIGLHGLIDEASGFQKVRPKDDLQKKMLEEMSQN